MCVNTYLSNYLPMYLSVYLPDVSIDLSICGSICLSVYIHILGLGFQGLELLLSGCGFKQPQCGGPNHETVFLSWFDNGYIRDRVSGYRIVET